MIRFTLIIGLLISFIAPQVQADQVMSVIGRVVLVRGQKKFQAVNRSSLKTDDTLATLADGGASFSLDNGAFVYVGPNTQIYFSPSGLQLEQGQIRVISRPNQSMTIATPEGNMFVNGGIHLIGASSKGTRFASQIGAAELQWKSNRPQWSPDRTPGVVQASYQNNVQAATLQAQRETQIFNGKLVAANPTNSNTWNIRVAQLQQQGITGAPGGATGVQPNGLAQNQGQADDQLRRDPNINDQADNQRSGGDPNQDEDSNRRPPDATATQYGSGSLASTFGGFSSGVGSSASGAGNSDANQATLQGQVQSVPGDTRFANGSPFPGNIHLIGSDTEYALSGLQATPAQIDAVVAPNNHNYFSIGDGALPTTQVSTDFVTATNINPNAIRIPGTNSYVLQLDQYGINDPALNNGTTTGITGLVGNPPSAPTVVGATPHLDERAEINDRATFALGEFRVGQNASGELEFAVRRSDQDRIILKDSGGNDANDIVTPNTQVQFTDAVDPRFLPAAPTVKVPIASTFDVGGTKFRDLNKLRRGAATVVLADQLFAIANATGQTRFAVDGKIIDIKGYRKP